MRSVLAVAALGAAAAAAVAARRRSPATGAIRHAGRVDRNVQLARLGSRSAATYSAHQARRVFASAERREELDAEFELRSAEQVAETLGQMKGALMKLGQMFSYLDEGLPEHLRAALAQLQQDAPPMSSELSAQVVEEELGGPPDRVFEEWDPVPVAAASIGQVHRAITRDGQAVAVKVQYPGVREAIESDLGNAGLLFGMMGRMFPGLEPGPIVAELRERLTEELDYRHEAANQRLFADCYAGHPFIHVPAVVDRWSTARVLTTELATGARFDEMESWDQAERDMAGEAIFRFVFRSLYRMHTFNGDPHPGNYLFRPGGRVTFLDFGLVKHFEPEHVAALRGMVHSMVIEPDPAAFRRAVEHAGFLPPGAPLTDEEAWDYFAHYYDLVRRDHPFTITSEYSSETVRRFLAATGEHAAITRVANVPPEFVIIQRINLGLYAVLARLHATANWRRVADELWPWVDGPPSTPLGEEEAAWLAARAGANSGGASTGPPVA